MARFLATLKQELVNLGRWSLAVVAGGLILASGPAWADAERLPSLKIAAGGITASGISSGAYMANQLHVAHSATVSGAGVFAAEYGLHAVSAKASKPASIKTACSRS